MKRSIFCLLVIVFFLHLASSNGVGISPAYYKVFFEPNLEQSFDFYSFSLDEGKPLRIYVAGNLSEYVNLSKTYLVGEGRITATIKLPDKIEKPGTHTIYIGAIEAKEDIETTVGGIASVRGKIDVIVPYPGEYTESEFKISSINQGEEAFYDMAVNNLGTESITVSPKIEIFKPGSPDPLLTKTIPPETPAPKEAFISSGFLDTKSFQPGDYSAIATINWGKETTTINKTLRVGEFLVDIVDYDYKFEQGKIAPFNIQIQNLWNSPIDEVFASVSITDEGHVVGDFKTVTVETSPWEIKNITGYFDTTSLEIKRYTARIELSYGNDSTSKLVAIYIEEPPAKTYKNYIIAAALASIIVIAVIIYLILKIRKLENENGKKKKKK